MPPYRIVWRLFVAHLQRSPLIEFESYFSFCIYENQTIASHFDGFTDRQRRWVRILFLIIILLYIFYLFIFQVEFISFLSPFIFVYMLSGCLLSLMNRRATPDDENEG